jgi:YHS domain-containing protein
MLFTTLIAITTLAPAKADVSTVCPVMKEPVPAKAKAVEYAGGRYAFCCAGCDVTFSKDPEKFVNGAKSDASPIGLFLFDPVSGRRILVDDAKGSSVYQGMRYLFASKDNQTKFEADPGKYAARPERESLTCPVAGDKIASHSAAAGYVDHDGVRFFVCCSNCFPTLEKDLAGTVAAGRGKPTVPKAAPARDAKPHEHAVNLMAQVKDCCQVAGACCAPGSGCCG